MAMVRPAGLRSLGSGGAAAAAAAAPAAAPLRLCGGRGDSADAAPLEVTQEAALAAAVRLPEGSPAFILGSSSAPRRALLAATGAEFEVMVPDIDEKAIGQREGGDPSELVRQIAEAKADALLLRLPPPGAPAMPPRRVVLLTGDQVVTYLGKIREKPRDATEALEFLSSYTAAPATTVGAICLHDVTTGRRLVGVHEASVHLAPEVPAPVLEAMAEEAVVLSCAGGLMVEHPALAPYVQRVEGGLDSVLGLSTQLLAKLLRELEGSVAPEAAVE